MEKIFLHYVLKETEMNLMERVVLKSSFVQDVLGATRKVYNKLNRCTSIV